jgi:hypothetical protein
VRGEKGNPRDSVFVWSNPRPGKTQPVRFARDQRWKLYGNGHLFDVAADPEEQAVVAAGASPEADAVRKRLKAAIDRMPKRPARTEPDS